MVLQVLLVLVTLAAMTMVLLGIGRLNHISSFDNQVKTEDLKKEILEDEAVVTENSVFNNLIAEKVLNKKNQNSSSNGPSSRRL